MSADVHPAFFAEVPPLRVRDPLAELFGAVPPGTAIEHTFTEVVKAAGHVCPTVAGAWLVTRAALAALYGDAPPVRVAYQPESVPPDPAMRAAMAGALAGDVAAGGEFRRLWLDRVHRILAAADEVVKVEPIAA